MLLQWLIVAFMFVPAWVHARTFEPLVLQSEVDSVHLIEQLYSLDNTKGEFTADQVFAGEADQAFKRNKDYNLFLGTQHNLRAGDFWVRFGIQNQWKQDAIAVFDYGTTPGVSRVFLLNIENPTINQVIDLSEKLKRTNRYIPIPPGSWRVFIEIAPDDFSLPFVSLNIRSIEAITQKAGELHFLSISYGICLALIAYNFILAITLRQRVHFIYITYIICLLFYYEGRYQLLTEQFGLPELPKWSLIPINASGTFLFVTFLYEILNVDKNLPSWKKPLRTILVMWPLLIVYSFIDRMGAQIILITILIISAPLSIALGLHAVKRRVPFCIPLLISTVLPGIGSAIHFLPQVFHPMLPMGFINSAQLLFMDFEMILLSMTIGAKINKEQEWLKAKVEHAYSELKTIVYPHQLTRIWNGESLGKTMPIGVQNAYVIAFDVVASSKMKIANPRAFLSDVLRDCSQLMLDKYQAELMTANAYRIKEMGDGFLCSVGYPFHCPHDNPAEHSLFLAHRFVEIFDRHVRASGADHEIHCAIGIAQGPVEAFYPESGAQVYDLFGKGIILAHRYESMRDILFRWLKHRDNIIIVQKEVFDQLNSDTQSELVEVDLTCSDFKVRDDEAATRLYYQLSEGRRLQRLLRSKDSA